MQPAPAAPRNVQQRRNPVNHTDLASVLELLEEVDACAHTGEQKRPGLAGDGMQVVSFDAAHIWPF